MALKYQRILLKISGEALGGEKGMGFDEPTMDAICGGVKKAHELGVQIGIVVGGGNFWRGVKDGGGKMERTRADHMGTLATVINALAVADCLEQRGVPVRVQTAIEMNKIAEPYIRSKAIRHLEKGRVVIFGCGTGNPFFSTDTAAALRAVEIGADAILLAKNVDGVYDSDPRKNPDAKPIDNISWAEFRKMVGDEWVPGKNCPFDPIASKKAQELGLTVICAGGKNIPNIKSILDGSDYIGSTIK